MQPEIFAIFHRNLSGDEALLRLMQVRFESAGLGAEIYPADVAEALHTWRFAPRTSPRPMVHLPRHWDVFVKDHRQQILAMASGMADRARGLVLHDRSDWPARQGELLDALGELEHGLGERADSPLLFLEYAAGLELEQYALLIEAAQPLSHVSACIDTGHVTVFTARAVLHRLAPEVNPEDPGTLKRIPLERLCSALAAAESQARHALGGLAQRLSRLAKPMHVHLHDGNLFSRWSMFPVRDHAPIGWDAGPGSCSRSLLGPEGVVDFLRALRGSDEPGRLSMTLEVHPGRRRARQPLGRYAPLFTHWKDLAHAEMTNAWIELLLDQHNLLRRLALQSERREGDAR